MFHLHSSLCCRCWQSAQYIHFALHLGLPRTPQLAVQPDGIDIHSAGKHPLGSLCRWRRHKQFHAGRRAGWAGRQRPCGASLSFAIIMLQRLQVHLQLFGFSCVANLREATCGFFTNLARWKFLYENHFVEISRESYDILVCERCPTVKFEVADYNLLSANFRLCAVCSHLRGGKSLVLRKIESWGYQSVKTV